MPNPNAVALNQEQGWRLPDMSQLLALAGGAANFSAISMSSSPATGTQTSLFWESAQDNITAFAGGGQASATPLRNEVNRVATVATAGDSVILPASAPGLTLMVINHGTANMQVFAVSSNPNNSNTADTIDDVAGATGVSQMMNSVVFYTCATAGKWYSEGLATGYTGQLQTLLSADNITANATGTQATATQLTAMVNRVATSSTAGAGVRLPTSAPGLIITLVNDGASSIQVFGNTTDSATIDGIGTATGVAMANAKRGQFICTTAGAWASTAGAKSS